MGVKMKEMFEVESKHGAFYRGGNVEWHDNILYCQKSSSVSLLDIDNGTVVKTIGEDDVEDPDIIHTFTTDGHAVVTSHKSGLLKLWNIQGELQKNWKSIHKGPVSKLALKGELLVSGGADSTVKIWNLKYQTCISTLRSCQGVIGVITFAGDQNILISGDDGVINLHELNNGVLETRYTEHYTKVISVVMASKEGYFVSAGRDRVLILWSIDNSKSLKVIPLHETIEAVIGLPIKFKVPGYKSDPENIYVATGGQNGCIRVWNVSKVKEVYRQSNSLVSEAKEGGLAITNLLFNEEQKTIAVITSEHNIILHHLKSFVCLKQFVGFSDEILDIAFVGQDDAFIAVATNSNDIKLYDAITLNCQLLKGHTDIVLALGVCKINPDLMLSSSKDKTVRLWKVTREMVSCLAVGNLHTGSVGSVCFSQTSVDFIVTVSQDTCVKLWEIPSSNLEKYNHLTCIRTEIAHEKDINCVTVSPNDKIIATASQDKTVKLWTNSLALIGTLKGHKRGVWSVRFSPADQILATSSADCTIKLWSIDDLSCLKTLEGHESSVLRIEFICNGFQLISTGSDGLLKVFNVKSSECKLTLDQHEDRIWALAVSKDESHIITGGADSILIKWKDVTEEMQLEKMKNTEKLILQEQQLNNYIQNDQLLKALSLALDLEKPFQTLKIIKNITKKNTVELNDAIRALQSEQKENLLKCIVAWNTNSKNSQVAQIVLKILIDELQSGSFKITSVYKMLEGVLPYTERHFKRVTKLKQDLHFLKYTIHSMQPYAKS